MGKDAEPARSERVRIEQHGSVGLLWIAAWPFTIGFLELTFWKGVLALVPRPCHLGAAMRVVLGT